MIIFGCDDDDNIGKDNDYDNVDWSLYHGIPPRRKHHDCDETFDDGGEKKNDDSDRFRLRCSQRE